VPEYVAPAELCLIANSIEAIAPLRTLASELRQKGLNVETDTTLRKIASSIKHADKRATPFIAVIGEDELSTRKLKLKHLNSGAELPSQTKDVAEVISTFLLEN
jgi:histidyl-tRNA synthetase